MSTKNIQTIINDFVKNQPKKKKLYEEIIKNCWNMIMPISIKNRTKDIFLINKTIVFKIDSGPLKHHLQLMEKEILKKLLNSSKLLEPNSIEKIIFE